ncbi:MAG: FAD-binding protein [Calditrichaeota bacterium]|nr:FAD-binding protein [Calditrichota bacterium]
MIFLRSRDPNRLLKRRLGSEKVLDKPEDLILYGMDATRERALPEAVVLAETTDDIRIVVQAALEESRPVVARGAGSGLSGGSVPVERGIVVSLEKMRTIESLDEVKKIAIVQPGVITSDLQTAAAEKRLFYPPDPSSYTVSTIGGNVAENAGGLRCFKYGVTSHYVLGLEFIDGEGNLQTTGIWSIEHREPDLTPLLIGSEGTLGVITRVALQLIALPPQRATLAAWFASSKAAFEGVEAILGADLVPSILEYIDGSALRAASSFAGIEVPEGTGAMLLIEVDGDADEVIQQLGQVRRALKGLTAGMEEAASDARREQFWQLRRSISPSLIRLSTGKIHEDIAVPRDRLAELAERVYLISAETELQIPCYGHAGDGNLHAVVLYRKEDEEERERSRQAFESLLHAAIDLGGTITGEHGVGVTKRDYLPWQHSPELISYGRRIKQLLDPHGIFNPGKIFAR